MKIQITKSTAYKIGKSSAFILLTIAVFLSLSLGSIGKGHAQGPCGDNYIVLQGDTVESIAELCGTSVEAILAVNPEITDPDNLFPGQIIRIPKIEPIAETVVALLPACGLANQEVLVVGSGFPENTDVLLSVGQVDQASVVVGETKSDELGMIDTTVIIPETADPWTIWNVIGQAQISSAKFLGISNKYYVIEQAPDPNSSKTYIVQNDDTLSSIAEKFNRSIDAIFQANPQIRQTTQILPGQTLIIPPADPSNPITSIAPICGPAETEILVSGNSFPPTSTIDLSLGQYLSESEQVATTTSNANGTFQTLLNIPSTAQSGELWVTIAETSTFPIVRSMSNIFTVTPPKDPKEPQLYIVKPGDTLNAIAAEFTRTVATILSVNPQIDNPNQLEIGEKIIIPGEQETILISPTSGTPSTVIQTLGLGFPPNSTVILGQARERTVVDDEGNQTTQVIVNNLAGFVVSDVNGNFQTQLTIPESASAGQIWSVIALERNTINADVIAKSNDFTVTAPQPPLQPIITIWPHSGPRGTSLSAVGSNYPSMTKINYTFGENDSSPFFFGITWTEINGTFAVDLIIPMDAISGDIWIINAEVVNDPTLQATSPEFTVE
jgi:LysM repeat protein